MPQNGGGKGWRTDPETGEKVMPDSWKAFLDWVLQGPARVPEHQYEWARENGVHEDSVRRWKRDPRFVKEWDRRAAELNIHPERTQSVIDALHQQAVAGSTQAASLLMMSVRWLVCRIWSWLTSWLVWLRSFAGRMFGEWCLVPVC